MHLSMWTYPWDIQDQGLETLAADLAGRAGLNTVSMATSYHAGRFLQPRSPQQKAYFPEDGTVYFRPDESFWQGKTICPSSPAVRPSWTKSAMPWRRSASSPRAPTALPTATATSPA